jgi:hypothetical protein
VAIRRIGTGAQLPSGYFLEDSITRDAPPRPSELAIVCGPSRYQVDFQLEAVGMEEGDADSADTLVPIDELSYRPAEGWSHVDLPYFHQVEGRFRGLAARSVFRYYRIKTPLTVPGYEGRSGSAIEKLEQILPIEDEQVVLALENGRLANRPATIHGVWFPNAGSMANSAPSLVPAPQPTDGDGGGALPMYYQGHYRLDTARGLVIFDEPVYRNEHPSAGGGSGYELQIAPAQLVLRAACRVRDPETFAFNAHVRRRTTGANGGGTRYSRHDELVLTHVPQYSANYSVAGVDTNLASVNETIDALLDVALAAYDEVEPRMARYAGLVAIDLDGAIRQVTYQVGPEGATTTVERNTERPGLASTFLERREIERTRATNAAMARLQPDNLTKCLQLNLRTKPRP